MFLFANVFKRGTYKHRIEEKAYVWGEEICGKWFCHFKVKFGAYTICYACQQ